MVKFRITSILLLFSLLSIGCVHNLTVHDNVVSDITGRNSSPYLSERKIILVIPKSRVAEISEQPISSVTGILHQWRIPIGQILTKTSVSYFSRISGEPVLVVDSVPDKVYQNEILIEPSIPEFKYWLNQLKNLGFAITAQSEVTLNIVEHGEQPLGIAGQYTSGRIDGQSYAIATMGGIENRISEAVILALMTDLEQVGQKIPVKKTVEPRLTPKDENNVSYKKMMELKDMYDKGVISQEEYEQLRKKYLDNY
ncbi:MAG: SHOCT domain-containing protein [Nitrospirae bacterium]|nr:SHOCT domain-containing protein [Nitrospirota bacterium]